MVVICFAGSDAYFGTGMRSLQDVRYLRHGTVLNRHDLFVQS